MLDALRLPTLDSSRLKLGFLLPALAAAMTLTGAADRAQAQCSGAGTQTYASSGSVGSPTLNFAAGSHTAVTSTVNVSGLPSGSTITCVSLVLNGVTTDGANHDSMDFASFMLTSPDGHKFEFLGSTGDGVDGDDNNDAGSGLAGVNITVADNASTAAPGYPSLWPHTGSVTVKPGSYYLLAANGTGVQPPLPVGGNSSQWAASDGSGTFSNSFTTGATANGTWTVTLIDNNPSSFAGTDPVSVVSWTLVMTTVQTANASTTTTLSSGTNPSFTAGTNSSVTLTSVVSSTGGTPTGTVQFTDGGTTISGCGASVLSGGTATCSTSFSTQGIHTLQATYSGGTGFNSSASPGLNQLVMQHTTLSGGQYCNSGAISSQGTTNVYPSIINVDSSTATLSGSVGEVTITLNGVNGAQGIPLNSAFLLVAPDGTSNLDFLDDVGTSSSQSSANILIADGGPSVPENGAVSSGTYGPTNYALAAPTFPASTSPAPAVPGTLNYAQPDSFGPGAKTLSQAFGGVNGNGKWSLFISNSSSEPLNLSGGWCLNFVVNNGAATTVSLNSSENPEFATDTAHITATVTAGGSPVNSGSVTFTDNGNLPAGVSNNVVTVSGGTATISIAGLAEGDHNINALYSGVNNLYDPSQSSIWQRVDNKSAVSSIGSGGSSAVYCNNGAFVIPGAVNNIGAASVNPTNVFVQNLGGTLNTAKVQLTNFFANGDTITDTASLLVGPNGKGYDFFSGAGASNTTLSIGNYLFYDAAASQVPGNAPFSPGSYQPASYNGSDIFTPNASSQYTLPGTYLYAAPIGTTTFSQAFPEGINPNGVWSLYFYQNIHDTGAGGAGWCMSLLENPVTGTGITSHTGPNPSNHMGQGGTGSVAFTLTNDGDTNGKGSTGDPDGSVANAMTVTGTFPAGLTPGTLPTGTPWNCSAVSSTITCTSTLSIAVGSSYPTLTIPVNVATNAPATVTVSGFTFSGADMTGGTFASDAIPVNPAAVLSVTKTAVGTFTQGSSAQWNIVVSNSAASASTTNGTITLNDALPSGFTLQTVASGNEWNCTSSTSTTVNCTTTSAIVGGSSASTVTATVSVPTNSPTSVTNTAKAWGGGDLTHTSSGSAVTGSSTVSVVQTPATVAVNAGNNQSTTAGAAFPTNLSVKVTDGGGVAISGATVVFLAPSSGASGTFAQGGTITDTETTNGSGVATATAFTANATSGTYSVSASSGTKSTTFTLTNAYVPVFASLQISAPAKANVGGAITATVSALDQMSNPFTGYAGTVHFTSTDGAAVLPGNYTFVSGDAGTHSFSVTLNTVGSQTVTVADTASPSINATTGPITVSIPQLVVTTANDDAGDASKCTVQTDPTNGTDSACSLRDSLLKAAALGSANITFDKSTFASSKTIAQRTITLGSAGTMSIPPTVTLTGPTTGTGLNLANLVTVDGASTYQVFNIASGTVAISNLTIANGNNTQSSTAGNGGGISNSGTLTLTNSTLTGNVSNRWGGGVYSNGPITVTGSTFAQNSAASPGGAIFADSATATISNSTIAQNSAFEGGGIYSNHATVNLKNVTVAGNQASFNANDFFDSGTLNLYNTVIGDLQTAGTPSDHGGNILGPTSLNLAPLGSYGGPTQTTIPLPGSTAICAGTTTNWTPLGADQRGLSTSDPSCASGAVDSGAVQSNYSIAFSQDASDVAVSTAMSPAPAVTLSESGSAFTVTSTPLPTVTIPLTLVGSGNLSGGSQSIDDSTGIATYSNLQIDTAAMSDKLKANVTLTSGISPAVVLSATSSAFEVTGGAASIMANSGTTPQSTAVGTAFSHALAVTVLDSANDPVSGVNVTFTAPGSGASGTFSNSTNTITVATNASGVASAPFTAGNTTGGPYTVTAAASSLTASFSLTNTAGAASTMTANAGTTPQSATVSTAFTNALAVTVKDALSNPVSGVTVTFTTPGSGASSKFSNNTNSIDVQTNSNGVASAPVTANGTAGGPYTVTAASNGLNTVNFSLTNTAGAASSMSANAGTTPQSTTVLTSFSNALAVTVKDSADNPVSGVNVTFTAPGSGASGTFSNSTATITVATNASGIASAPFTANGTAGGPYTVTAASNGLTTVNFSLTNNPGAASAMTANAGTTPQSATVSTAFANALAVTVKDSSQNPISGVSVTFTAPGSGASGKFSNTTATITVVTNSNGVASAPITANTTAGGPYTVTATSNGLTTVNFSLTNTAGAASSMTANAGTTPQSATVLTAFGNALAVTVVDASNNPVSGVSVTFAAPGSGASGKFSNNAASIIVQTNASGIASAPFTANSTAGGPYSVTASANGVTSVTFSLTNTAGAAASMTTNAGTTPQSTIVNNAFANALAVTVKDASSNPVSGVNVTFTAPAAGASGAFSNSSNTITVATNASGVASAGIFTANGTPGGPYSVSASGASLSTSFSLTNVAATLTVTCPATNAGSVGAAFNSGAETVNGGVKPYTFYISSGTLPNGLMLDSTTGTVSGIPTKVGTFSIGVKDATNKVATTTCGYVIGKGTPVISWSPAPIVIGGKLSSAQLDATANVPGKFVYTPASGTVVSTSTETLKVVFTPTDTADYNTVTKTVSLTVETVTVSPTSIDFGTVYLNSITTKSVTVTNLGTSAVTVSSPLISILTDGNSKEFVAINLCVTPLQPHKSCTIQVSFVAGPFYHQQSATMSVKYSGAGSPQNVSLTALTIDPVASLSTTSLAFGTQKVGTTSASKTITLTNSGATSLTINGATVSGTDPKDFTLTNHCSSPLAAGSSCTFGVTFKPGAKGSRTAKLTITDNAKVSSSMFPSLALATDLSISQGPSMLKGMDGSFF